MNIPHDDFSAGFTVGCQVVLGTEAPLPLTIAPPLLTEVGMTPFLEGVQAGIEAAGADLVHPGANEVRSIQGSR